MSIFYIGAGGFFGATSRYIVSIFFENIGLNTNLSTIFVNVFGSFLMGIMFYFLTSNSSDFYKMFFVIGFLGSFTTFSAFSLDSLNLLLSREYFELFLYIASSVFVSILFIFIGFILAKEIY